MKSGFEQIKEDICKEIMKTQSIYDLKEELKHILEEYDLEEDRIN